jgi:hypothetical protein
MSFVILALANTSLAQDFSARTAEAKQSIESTEVAQRNHYCLHGQLNCRTIVRLKDKVSGQLVPDFYETFFSVERAVANTAYYMMNPNVRYRVSGDDSFDGVVAISRATPGNQNLQITFDSNGLPIMSNFEFKRLGTNRVILADLKYTTTNSALTGIEFDVADEGFF